VLVALVEQAILQVMQQMVSIQLLQVQLLSVVDMAEDLVLLLDQTVVPEVVELGTVLAVQDQVLKPQPMQE
jgi:hypothetical protein